MRVRSKGSNRNEGFRGLSALRPAVRAGQEWPAVGRPRAVRAGQEWLAVGRPPSGWGENRRCVT